MNLTKPPKTPHAWKTQQEVQQGPLDPRILQMKYTQLLGLYAFLKKSQQQCQSSHLKKMDSLIDCIKALTAEGEKLAHQNLQLRAQLQTANKDRAKGDEFKTHTRGIYTQQLEPELLNPSTKRSNKPKVQQGRSAELITGSNLLASNPKLKTSPQIDAQPLLKTTPQSKKVLQEQVYDELKISIMGSIDTHLQSDKKKIKRKASYDKKAEANKLLIDSAATTTPLNTWGANKNADFGTFAQDNFFLDDKISQQRSQLNSQYNKSEKSRLSEQPSENEAELKMSRSHCGRLQARDSKYLRTAKSKIYKFRDNDGSANPRLYKRGSSIDMPRFEKTEGRIRKILSPTNKNKQSEFQLFRRMLPSLKAPKPKRNVIKSSISSMLYVLGSRHIYREAEREPEVIKMRQQMRQIYRKDGLLIGPYTKGVACLLLMLLVYFLRDIK